ncbi:ABATE domain-containing protein [Actinorhabdospora filicis]|uniref:ABATE domain-containing protein n=1 Tax=Actinorhabdospora filicis TaxID=1785913 RepID=UPI0025542E4B|nr:ABATE domain-containing protein [Actinorhabdospora filicis]
MNTGFRPAHRLTDLANLLHEDPEANNERITAVLAVHGEHDTVNEEEAEDLRAAVNRLSTLLAETDENHAAEQLNAILAAHAAPPRLERHDGHPWHLHVEPRGASWSEWLLAASAHALARLLGERGRIAWGKCPGNRCPEGPYFVDDGPGLPRRFCSQACAARERQAALRRRRREAGE